MKITTAAEMGAIDRRTTAEYGVPSLELMEAAGSACAELALTAFPQAQRIAILCGKGNNGGDGFVAARKLHAAGCSPRVLLLASPSALRGDAEAMFHRMGLPYVEIGSEEELRAEAAGRFGEADLILDALLGAGFRPPVTGLYAAAIAAINQSGLPVLAVDVPSGANSDGLDPVGPVRTPESSICRADAMVTFTAPRPAHVLGNLTEGPIRVADIGSPDEAIRSELKLEVITAGDLGPLLAPRTVDANKGGFGHALIIGGSFGKSGAVAMSGLSALRAGAGLSTVATPRSSLPMVASHCFEIMTEPLAETESGTISPRAAGKEDGQLDSILKGKDVVAIGPGVSRHPETAEFVRAAVSRCKSPMVIDADGLNAFEHRTDALDGRERTLVLTPHPGEMARLAGLASPKEVQRDRLGVARRFAREHRLILVLKGWRTLVAFPDETVWINPTGNPGMASGGTGDVLTGIMAGLLAQFPDDVARAVRGAVYLHGLAGDIAREHVGEKSLIAGDLITYLPEAFRRAQEWSTEKLVRLGSV